MIFIDTKLGNRLLSDASDRDKEILPTNEDWPVV